MRDLKALQQMIESKVEEHNEARNGTQLDMVVFLFAMEHISRLCRILRLTGGHALLVGVGGSGRKSAARLAAFISGVYVVTLSKKGKMRFDVEWRRGVADIVLGAGRRYLGDGGKGETETAFVVTERELSSLHMVEDISSLLSTGEIPGLFDDTEIATICEKMMPLAVSKGHAKHRVTKEQLMRIFSEIIKRHLHLVVCFSPVGTLFRDSVRKFPALVNCCTIDWFRQWPQDALKAVAIGCLGREARGEGVIPADDLAKIFVDMHVSAQEAATCFLREERRYAHITPTSYLELLRSFDAMLTRRSGELELQKERYDEGLAQLHIASEAVGEMQSELRQLEPQLQRSRVEVDEIMVGIVEKKPAVEAQRLKTQSEETVVKRMEEECLALMTSAEQDLQRALPALEEADGALRSLTKNQVSELKVLKNPPSGVRLAMEACCIMLDVKPKKVRDPDDMFNSIEDFWPPSQQLLSKPEPFLDRLFNYDKENIPPERIARIRKGYTENNPDFQPEAIEKASGCAAGVCRWVFAMDLYERVLQDVKPKRAQLQKAEEELAMARKARKIKREKLAAITLELETLQRAYDEAEREKINLEQKCDSCSTKLLRAEQLLGSLGGESERWAVASAALAQEQHNLWGDVVIAAGVVAYLGAFSPAARINCIDEWKDLLGDRGVPSALSFSLERVLGNAVQTRQWHIEGLPMDPFSIENAIIMEESRFHPLIVDPQGQGRDWLCKRKGYAELLRVVHAGDPHLLEKASPAISLGRMLLIDEVGESLPPPLESLVDSLLLVGGARLGGRQPRRKSSTVLSFSLGKEETVEFNPDFRLYLLTRLRNPHFLPEVQTRIKLINFQLTPRGLQDKLLSIVVREESPALEKERKAAVVKSKSWSKARPHLGVGFGSMQTDQPHALLLLSDLI